jgi:hypothetical protein
VKARVSIEGGTSPTWRERAGVVLPGGVWTAGRLRMMAVDITTSRLFYRQAQNALRRAFREVESVWGLRGDPRRAAVPAVQTLDEPSRPATHVNVVLNWFEELKRRVPTD